MRNLAGRSVAAFTHSSDSFIAQPLEAEDQRPIGVIPWTFSRGDVQSAKTHGSRHGRRIRPGAPMTAGERIGGRRGICGRVERPSRSEPDWLAPQSTSACNDRNRRRAHSPRANPPPRASSAALQRYHTVCRPSNLARWATTAMTACGAGTRTEHRPALCRHTPILPGIWSASLPPLCLG